MALIELHNATKRYGNVTAVDRISLHINEGQTLALLGASGCGKTSVLRLVAGLERPDDGEIWLGGHAVSRGNVWIPAERRNVGMVFQDYSLFPHLTIKQNVNFALANVSRGIRQQRLSELLELVGLSGLENRFPHQLSGGQQQRVALARALAPSPDVILLDEPFSNLDAALRQAMREELRQILRQAQITTIFVTHDQEEALSLADQVVVMSAGRILQVGTPQEVYFQPTTKAVAAFVGEASFLLAHANGDVATSVLGEHLLQKPQYGDVVLLIRPEMLQLQLDEDGEATIEQSIFLGYDQKLTLRFADNSRVVARVRPQAQWAIGKRVKVSLEATLIAYPQSG